MSEAAESADTKSVDAKEADAVLMLDVLAAEYERLHLASCELMRLIPPDKLYWHPQKSLGGISIRSCGEHILRSAATVEQAFGGITANLWDDPFEWTLPEALATPAQIICYFEETAETRRRGFALFASDADLRRRIAMPSGDLVVLGELLTRTLMRAAQLYGEACATFAFFSEIRLPRL